MIKNSEPLLDRTGEPQSFLLQNKTGQTVQSLFSSNLVAHVDNFVNAGKLLQSNRR